MKKILVFLPILAFTLGVYGQKVSGYSYKLENGVTVKMERTWSRVWVQQAQEAFTAAEQPQSVAVNIRTMGDITKSHSFKLTAAGKDVRLKDAAPGTYDLKITSSLSGNPGSLITDITGIVVKPKMKTTVNVTLYDYQIITAETPSPSSGLASTEFIINRFRGNNDQNYNSGVPSFYARGSKDNKITPAETPSKNKAKIKPGTYDVLVTIEIPGHNQRVWLENFVLKPDVASRVSINMNAGEIVYAGTLRDVTRLHLYPAGTADKLQGAAKPDKATEFMVCEPATARFPCPPGSFDVLLNIGNGKRYEWRKNIIVRTGSTATVT